MNRATILSAALALVVFAGPALAANPTGTWKSTATIGNQTFESLLKLRYDSEGPRLTGTYIQGPSSEPSAISSANYKDGQISFQVRTESDDQHATIKFSGKLHRETMTGSFEVEKSGQVYKGNWVATRQK